MSEIRLDLLPKYLVSEISQHLSWYTTVLIRNYLDDSGREQTIHIGSGTFVTIGKAYGILTAQHVAAQLRTGDSLGLVMSQEGQEHKLVIPRYSIQIIDVANRETDEFGPDLSFILITDSNRLGAIRASKSFFPLLQQRDQLLSNPPPINKGIWWACGAPGEFVTFEKSIANFANVMTFRVIAYGSGVDETYEKEAFDYHEMLIDSTAAGSPKDFSGMSGGGLWQVSLRLSPDGTILPILPEDYRLSGVVFYQGIRDDGSRYLRCHGRMSVYSLLLEKVLMKHP